MSSEYKILVDAYSEAVKQGDTATAATLLQEMDAIAIAADYDRARKEKGFAWRVG